MILVFNFGSTCCMLLCSKFLLQTEFYFNRIKHQEIHQLHTYRQFALSVYCVFVMCTEAS